MKKRSVLLLLVLLVPLFTACGSDKSLVCFEELNDGEFRQSLIINYNDEKTKVESSSVEIKININEIDLTNIGCTKETKKECLEELKTKYNESCNNMLENCKITDETENGFTFNADIKNEKQDEYFYEISTTLPINQMRSKIETKYGFTCE